MEQLSVKEMIRTYSTEAKGEREDKKVEVGDDGKRKNLARSILDKIKEIPAKAENINKNAKMFIKRKNVFFYKRYLGRVEAGLFERYGPESEVLENKMVDDPVNILRGPARDYIRDIVKDLNKLYLDFRKVCEQLEDKTTSEECIAVIKPYISKILDKTVKGEAVNKEKMSYKEQLVQATRLKIANILLRNGNRKVYGYTAENMVLKKFPPPNHLIVTLFVTNPEERPIKQPVTEIFESPESFKIMAYADKNDAFNVVNMTRSVMEKTVDGKIINDIKEFKSNAIQKFKQGIGERTSKEKMSEEVKIIDSIWEGIRKSSNELLDKKVYIIDCINIYFEMIMRIDKLCVNSIKAMLQTELEYKDDKYKTGVSYAKKDKTPEEKEERKENARKQTNMAKNLNKSFK